MHRKRVGNRYYYYTTVRRGKSTKSVYLGVTRSTALKKIKNMGSKKELFSFNRTKRFVFCFLFFVFLSMLFFLVMYFMKDINITGKVVLDVDDKLSTNAYMVIDGERYEIPIELIKAENGGWYYNLNEIDVGDLRLEEGVHLIEIYDGNRLVYSDVVVI